MTTPRMIDPKYYEILRSAELLFRDEQSNQAIRELANYVLQEIYDKGFALPSGFDDYDALLRGSQTVMIDTKMMAVSTMNTYLERSNFDTLCVTTFASACDDLRIERNLSAYSRLSECVNILTTATSGSVNFQNHVQVTKNPSGYFFALELVKAHLPC